MGSSLWAVWPGRGARDKVATAFLRRIFETFVLYREVRIGYVLGRESVSFAKKGLGKDGVHNFTVTSQYFLFRTIQDTPSVTAGRHKVIPEIKEAVGLHTPEDAGVFVFNGKGGILLSAAGEQVRSKGFGRLSNNVYKFRGGSVGRGAGSRF